MGKAGDIWARTPPCRAGLNSRENAPHCYSRGMTPSQQIESLLAKYPPAMVKLARACLAKLRKRLPYAVELVYDYGFQLVFSFGATENGSEAVFSLAVKPETVSLFMNFKDLPDPEKRLRGSGKQVRGVQLETPAALDDPYIVTLMEAALAKAKVPLDPKAKRKLVIKSNSAKKR